MNGQDRGNEPEWPIRGDRPAGPDPRATPPADTAAVRQRKRINPVLIALAGLVLLLLLLWLFTSSRSTDQDKLTGNETTGNSVAADDPEKRCASKATYDLIKRELFRRAAQVRGSEQSAFDRLSAYASLRMENPVLVSESGETGAVQCSGSLSLDLPPGVAVAGGRRSLSAEVDYSVQPAADGSGSVVLLRNADGIITPLATLGRVAQPAPQPASIDDAVNEPAQPSAPDAPQAPQAAPPSPQAQPEPTRPASARPEPTRPTSARPSFNCANARTRGEREVCSDAGLAALDRSMSAQFGRAMSAASPTQRRLLEQTRGGFLAYRDRCPNRACIGDAYTGRMREIRDIMEGRWQGR